MEIEHWNNNEEWGSLRDIVNELVDAVNLSMPPVGSVIAMPSETAPNARYRILDGQELSRTTYSELFAILGTTHGDGDGTTTFNLPDMRGKAVIGLSSSESEFDEIGKTGGVKDVTLTADQSGLRDHAHYVGGFQEGAGAIGNIMKQIGTDIGLNTGDEVINVDGEPERDGAQDALEAHTNLPPYLTLNWMMRVL